MSAEDDAKNNQNESGGVYDIVIVGDGPAGLSAAIYSARANMKTIVIGKNEGYLKMTKIENYFGFKSISGEELLRIGREQAEMFGAEIVEDEVVNIEPRGETYIVKTPTKEYECRGIVIAVGVEQKNPGIPKVNDYVGRGVSYCVVCDGFFYKDLKVAAVGEGDYAAKEALELLNYTKNVTLLTNGKKEEMSDVMKKKLEENGIKINRKKIVEILGNEQGVKGVRYEDGETEDFAGIFIAVGNFGVLDMAKQIGLETIDGKYVKVDRKNKTNLPKVYAAGDCTGGNRQVAIAVGEGANAALNLISELTGTEYVDYKHIVE